MKRLTATVTADYEAAYPRPIRAAAGTVMRVEREDEEYPGWVWCVATDGVAGWVAEVFLERNGRVAVLRRDYEATELTARAGERLTLGEEVSGWWWAQTEAGRKGWIPADHLRLEPGEATAEGPEAVAKTEGGQGEKQEQGSQGDDGR